jgi:hypothetical protein
MSNAARTGDTKDSTELSRDGFINGEALSPNVMKRNKAKYEIHAIVVCRTVHDILREILRF